MISSKRAMYSTDLRTRVANYDRMRVDKAKVGTMLDHSRAIRKKLKNRQSGVKMENNTSDGFVSMSNGFSSPVGSPKRKKDVSTGQFDLVDSMPFT